MLPLLEKNRRRCGGLLIQRPAIYSIAKGAVEYRCSNCGRDPFNLPRLHWPLR